MADGQLTAPDARARDLFLEVARTADGEPILKLCWHTGCIGSFSIRPDPVDPKSGALIWRGYEDPVYEKIFVTRPDGMPMFLANLRPENDIIKAMVGNDQGEYIEDSLRFLSNILVSPNCPFDRPVVFDALHGRLRDFTAEDGGFAGRYQGPDLDPASADFVLQLEMLWGNKFTPRASGAENKIPCFLAEDGRLVPSTDATSPFTHFLKIPRAGPTAGWGVNEWMCMELVRATGQPTAEGALVDFNPAYPPAFLVERFDIPDISEVRANNAANLFGDYDMVRTWRMIQDFCTLAGVSGEQKAEGSIERMAKLIRGDLKGPRGAMPDLRAQSFDLNSDQPVEEDMQALFRRTFSGWLVRDLDMHRKNISMMIEFDSLNKELVSRRFAPVYDVTSEIYVTSVADMTLSVNGRRNRIAGRDFIALAQSMGIDEATAVNIMRSDAQAMLDRCAEIVATPPAVAVRHDIGQHTINRIATIVCDNARSLGFDNLVIPDLAHEEVVALPKGRHYPQPDTGGLHATA